jgi:hypothetical protein
VLLTRLEELTNYFNNGCFVSIRKLIMSSVSISTAASSAVSNVASQKDAVLVKKAGKQQEAVVATLLEGISESPRPQSAPTGQVLNVKA